ncbi:LysR family transcriptional regulator [Sulfuriferula plumbiphila]|uniref:LysR family transcriptional regulator n=1 Tax=Sulfuriferula plumbiphila TaxID=171865 RepID=A0A512L9Y5_9PROT|nr:LysR family transcriptional regulator [Sulfuriferula plumbiphila]BBP05222.1 LysR family transcriptional regulator [Sulfuriferula plumbiphila]GEP31289.1 LysR family transcriptional regulator [Sulfuriferula plumbiphila]
MFIRQLDYLVTLSREKHFARAAKACYVSQPALSAAIRHLEEELGVPIVQRGQRFQGLTPEGERILNWARKTLAAWEGLRQEASIARTHLAGTLRLGAIPTTMPIVSLLTGPFRAAHSEMCQLVQSLSTEEIIRRLDSFELDLGLTYLEDQCLEGFRVLPLYRERYMLLARDPASIGDCQEMSWANAAELPLCLLTNNMQNRRIINAAFRRANAQPRVVVETDSVFALYSHVRCAELFSIVPHSLLCLFEMREELAAIPLTPEINRAIGLIALDHDPLSPMVAAAWAVTQTLDLEARFDTMISGTYQPIRAND